MKKNSNNKDRPRYRKTLQQEEGGAHPLTGKYYDTAEMMHVMHVSDRTLFRWRKEGKIPYKKLGGKIYYLADAVDEIMRESDGEDR